MSCQLHERNDTGLTISSLGYGERAHARAFLDRAPHVRPQQLLTQAVRVVVMDDARTPVVLLDANELDPVLAGHFCDEPCGLLLRKGTPIRLTQQADQLLVTCAGSMTGDEIFHCPGRY